MSRFDPLVVPLLGGKRRVNDALVPVCGAAEAHTKAHAPLGAFPGAASRLDFGRVRLCNASVVASPPRATAIVPDPTPRSWALCRACSFVTSIAPLAAAIVTSTRTAFDGAFAIAVNSCPSATPAAEEYCGVHVSQRQSARRDRIAGPLHLLHVRLVCGVRSVPLQKLHRLPCACGRPLGQEPPCAWPPGRFPRGASPRRAHRGHRGLGAFLLAVCTNLHVLRIKLLHDLRTARGAHSGLG